MADTNTSSFKYKKWEGGEIITADELNNIENGIANVIQEPFIGVTTNNNSLPKEGLVPAPGSGDGKKFLSAKGTWEEVETPNDRVKVNATGTNIEYKILLQKDEKNTTTYTAVSSDKVKVKNDIITAEGFIGSGAGLTNLNGTNITEGEINANYLPKLNQINDENTQTSTITQGIIENIETNHLSAIDNKLRIKFLRDNFKISNADVGKVLMVDKEGYIALSSVKFASAEAGF